MTTHNALPTPVRPDPIDDLGTRDAPSDVRGTTPRAWRRVALLASGFLACALPVVWTVNFSRMLLTGVEPEHRFHQATGQGLVLTALWLGGLVPLLVAGWAGRRPSTRAGLLHLTFVATGAACAVLAPGGGAPVLMGIIGVTGALVWAVLPQRPALGSPVRIDPLVAPVALLASALFAPYAIAQIGLQNAATGYHAQNPHFFDMAWLAAVLVVISLLSALLVSCRRLLAWVAAASLAIGVAGLGFGETTSWSLGVAGVGIIALTVVHVRRRVGWDR